MLSSIVKEHQVKQSARKESQGKNRLSKYIEIEQQLLNYYYYYLHVNVNILIVHPINNRLIDVKRKEAVTAANELTNALVEHLNVGYVI